MRNISKIAKRLDDAGLYKLSDKLFKIAQDNLLNGYKTFNYEQELIDKPTRKFIIKPINDYILKPVDEYVVKPVDKFTDLTTEGTNKLTKAVDKYTVKPAVGIAKYVDNKAKQIAKTPAKIKQKINPPKDTDTFGSTKLDGTMVYKDYKSNILKYKQLVGEKKISEAYKLIDDVFASNVLNSSQKAAFLAQVNRINQYYSVGHEIDADEPLYTQGYIDKMLKKYKISLSDIKRENLSKDEFDKRWEDLKKELPEEKQNQFQNDFLQRTYDILTAHYGSSV